MTTRQWYPILPFLNVAFDNGGGGRDRADFMGDTQETLPFGYSSIEWWWVGVCGPESVIVEVG